MNDTQSPGHANNANGRLLSSAAFYVTPQIAFTGTDKLSISNFGQKGENNMSSQAQGGAFYFTSAQMIGANKLYITNNTVAGGNVDGAHQQNNALGGAVYGLVTFISGSGEISFSYNSAIAGDLSNTGRSSDSGIGGAMYAAQLLSLGAAGGKVKFTSNQAFGGKVIGFATAERIGLGGAAGAATIQFESDGDVTFSMNKAIGSNVEASGTAKYSGMGGAIYTYNELAMGNHSSLKFLDNLAQGGEAKDAGQVSFSGLGGAIASFNVFSSGAGTKLYFENNKAQAGQAHTGASTASSGLGGAIYFEGKTFDLTASSFINNSAYTPNAGDFTSGRGGAIFFEPIFDQSVLQNLQITLTATENNDISFSNNTHNPGGGAARPNSLYFGNTKGEPETAYHKVVFDCKGENSYIYMYDPMEAQPDGLQDQIGNTYGKTSTRINKKSSGVWLLGGHNLFPSSSHWSIDEGALRLAANLSDARPANIDLTHADSSFTLKNGSTLMLEAAASSHRIHAADITLESGSLIDIAPASSCTAGGISKLPYGYMTVVSLETQSSGTLVNNSAIVHASGTFDLGPYKYSYANLAWDESRATLGLTIEDTVIRPGVDGREALAIPTISAFTLPESSIMHARLGRNFQSMYERRRQKLTKMPDDEPPFFPGPAEADPLQRLSGAGDFQSRPLPYAAPGTMVGEAPDYRIIFPNPHHSESILSLQARPYYQHSRYSAVGGQSKFNINDYGISLETDWILDDYLFVGAVFMAGRPEYDSDKITAEGYLLGGALHAGLSLNGFINLGVSLNYLHTAYEQTRRVDSGTCTAEYNSSSLGGYFELSARLPMFNTFSLLPFASYNWQQLEIDDYKEKGSLMSLAVGKREQTLRQYRIGLQGDVPVTSKVHMSMGGYFYNTAGDMENRAEVYFINDTSASSFTSRAGELENKGVGTFFSAKYAPGKNFDFGLDYGLQSSENSTSHQGTFTLRYSF